MAGRSITKKIGALEFSVLSPNEIRKMSATKVITADTYDDDGSVSYTHLTLPTKRIV